MHSGKILLRQPKGVKKRARPSIRAMLSESREQGYTPLHLMHDSLSELLRRSIFQV